MRHRMKIQFQHLRLQLAINVLLWEQRSKRHKLRMKLQLQLLKLLFVINTLLWEQKKRHKLRMRHHNQNLQFLIDAQIWEDQLNRKKSQILKYQFHHKERFSVLWSIGIRVRNHSQKHPDYPQDNKFSDTQWEELLRRNKEMHLHHKDKFREQWSEYLSKKRMIGQLLR